MQKKKENFINKIVKKNYEAELEKILEKKSYSENVKSLLLSILYKIEDSYKDYKTVKKHVLSKEEYIEKLIKIILKKCEKIELKNIDNIVKNKNKLYEVNIQEKKIECYPIEKDLLYAIANIDKKDNIVKNQIEEINESMTNLLNIGNSIEFIEPLRDFNGWSWNNQIANYGDIVCNFVYQIMKMLVGNEFLLEWIDNSEKIIDYLDYFINEIESKYGKIISDKLIENIIKISLLVEVIKFKEKKGKFIQKKNQLEEMIEKLENKENYVQEITQEKIKINEQIGEIDKKLNDKSKLKEEYEKRNEKLELNQKIFSLRVLTKILIDERQELINKIEEYNENLKPENYCKKKSKLENELKIFSIFNNNNLKSEIEKYILELGKNYLECLKIKIENAKFKEELISLLYEMRYFCQLPYDLEKASYNMKRLDISIKNVSIQLIKKCIENNIIIDVGSKEENINQIAIVVFFTKIIELEKIYIEIENKNNKYIIKIFDENVLEKSYEVEINDKNEFDKSKLNKKIKVLL